ncbi:hypothetical protein MBAV_003950 [Candidatus Magnetobacterium bavaricum]|uniref:Uncharacterized protein n=1 Tax=Candidatus Magnetobacterium bavaricum TaxID=29290 RepID=A0A0F3GPX8_9BACT|nr:hypothetical protein MBAV_003950 [Candidatus Magnetobacterium bavaricum]
MAFCAYMCLPLATTGVITQPAPGLNRDKQETITNHFFMHHGELTNSFVNCYKCRL